MLFAYVDETGDTGSLDKRGSSRCFGLGCVLIDGDAWPHAVGTMVDLRRGLRERHGILIRRELKSTQIVSGSGALLGLELPPHVRRGIFAAHLRTLAPMRARAFSIVIDKERNPSGDWFHVAWETLLQRLERTSSRTPGRPNILVIHDNGENAKVRMEVRKARRFLTAGSAHGTGTFQFRAPLVEDPVPRDSASSYLLQLADMVAYAGWRTYMKPSATVARVVPSNAWEQIGDATHTAVNGYRLNGSVPGVVLR
ncbi:DUF3800 domain-containing protein [Leifsonia aquatica]|uniref:DUF3800 domain-containing protein n=1 Tax=Leifsonia aquatica TaxID=144185 RepID=UPI00382193F3